MSRSGNLHFTGPEKTIDPVKYDYKTLPSRFVCRKKLFDLLNRRQQVYCFKMVVGARFPFFEHLVKPLAIISGCNIKVESEDPIHRSVRTAKQFLQIIPGEHMNSPAYK